MEKINFFLDNEDKEKLEKWYLNYHELDRDLEVVSVKKGIILPTLTIKETNKPIYFKGGVIDEKQNYIPLSGLYRDPLHINKNFRYTLNEGYKVQEQKIEHSSEKIIYCGIFQKQWGHFLLESTVRLWFYYKNPIHKIAFTTIDGNKPSKQFSEAFKLLKIPDDKIIFIDKPTQFEEVIIPEVSFVLSNYAHKNFLTPFEKMSENVKPNTFKKIYISRTRFDQNKNIIGEETFEKTFKENGFKIIYPEKLSVKEQISYIKGADYIAGFISSGLHNSIFAKPGTNLIILEKFNLMNCSQCIINIIKKLKAVHIGVYYTFLPVSWSEGPFLVGITENFIEYLKTEKFYKIPKLVRMSKDDIIVFIKQWGNKYKDKKYIPHSSIEECVALINKIFNKELNKDRTQPRSYFKKITYYIKTLINKFKK